VGKGLSGYRNAGPHVLSFKLENCPLCGSDKHELLYITRDRHYGISGIYQIVQCTGCSLIFLNPMYTDAELSPLYPQDYYAYQDDNFHRPRWKEIIKAILNFRIHTRDPKFEKPGKMLDVGCGTGWFMFEMRKQGWDVHGVEISAAAADVGRKAAGLNIFSGTLEEAKFPDDSFDYIRSNHSFEHISNPGPTLDEIHRILKPGGKLMIGVPNVTGLNARIFKKYWWYLGAPVHTFNYSVKTLSEMLKKHRFAVQKVTYNSDFSGILGSAQIWTNRNNGRKSTEGVLMGNPVLMVGCQWLSKFIDLLQQGDAIELTSGKVQD
jgi:SAM-dependent methyltransferase